MKVLKTILAPLASLKLTVVLMALSLVLVHAGTLAQRDFDNWTVQKTYFRNAFVWVSFRDLVPMDWKAPPWLRFPMPGGYILGLLLLVNLVAAHVVRFKLGWKRVGIILTHAGIILLLVSEGITANTAVETQMTVREGQTVNWSQDIREVELAITDPSPADHEEVIAIPSGRLRAGETIRDQRFPFVVKVDEMHVNAELLGPNQQGGKTTATAGALADMKVKLNPVPSVTGLDDSANAPGGFVTLATPEGQPLGTYLVSVLGSMADVAGQEVRVGDKTYQLELRFRRYYHAYKVHLIDFAHDRYTGTGVAKNFSSRIRFTDPTRNEDREIVVKMNSPFRYEGETFYQSGFDRNREDTTILQIVDNGVWLLRFGEYGVRAWMLPYIACTVAALGMLVHFGMVLVAFDRKRSMAALAGLVRGSPPPLPRRGGSVLSSGVRELAPRRTFWTGGTLLPLGVVLVASAYLVSIVRPPKSPAGEFNLSEFARLPVSFEGRVQPIDSLARNGMRAMGGRQTVTVGADKDGKGGTKVGHVEWLARTFADADRVEDQRKTLKFPVFRVDHADVKSLLSGDPKQTRYSYGDVIAAGDRLFKQFALAEAVPGKKRDVYQQKLMEFGQKLSVYEQLAQPRKLYLAPPQKAGEDWMPWAGDPLKAQRFDELLTAFEAALNASSERDASFQALSRHVNQYRGQMLASPPEKKHFQELINAYSQGRPADFARLAQEYRATYLSPQPEAAAFQQIIDDYRGGKVADFNRRVAEYRAQFQAAHPAVADRVTFEAFFNHYDPFGLTRSAGLYVLAFILAAASWLGWSRPLLRASYALLAVTLLVHTLGLIGRIYISGRPPVTNLASSAIFIAWGGVVLALVAEIYFKNGIGSAAAAVMGFASLLIAHYLALDGDTMKVLQAVLDTNGWLASHVVIVTLGYSSTFLAGLFGIIYIMRGVFTDTLTKEEGRNLTRMTYGIVCFSVLFSFVGTVLGGIWADQSWGRFWGWDPKENGAVLVVIWNTLVLHARWAGWMRDRGLAVAAVFGNIVTAWSWFGTNNLSIGLHSYGFTSAAAMWLSLFVGSQAVLMLIGGIPRSLWRSADEPQQHHKRGFEPVVGGR